MIRPHHYAWPKMWPIPTDVSWSVSQSVCFCVGHDSELLRCSLVHGLVGAQGI